MTADSLTLLTRLRAIAGAQHVLTRAEHGDLSAYERDWRRRCSGHALAVVRPGDTAEVAAVVQACAEAGTAVVPQGGNTGLVGGGVPDDSGTQVLLSLRRLQRVRAIDAANLTITVEAGCVLQAVQQAAADAGLLLPLSLAAEGSCTIGGNLATNAGGTQVLRYGCARALCLGLEVVTPQGEVWQDLSGLRKDNSGYALRELYVGSEGTLGVITAATLALYPQPAATMTALAACASLADALRLLDHSRRRLGAALTGFEVMNACALDIVARQFPQQPRPFGDAALPAWTVLIELADGEGEAHARTTFESLLADALDGALIGDAVVAASVAQSRALWHLRESIPLAQAAEGLNIKHDIALPLSRIADFVERTDAALAAAWPGVRLVAFGHLGDGNLHYNVQAPLGADAAAFLREHEHAVNTLVFDAVAAHGGSFSAEHGIGAFKRDELARRKHPVALATMRAIKAALDPRGLMNPGRLL